MPRLATACYVLALALRALSTMVLGLVRHHVQPWEARHAAMARDPAVVVVVVPRPLVPWPCQPQMLVVVEWLLRQAQHRPWPPHRLVHLRPLGVVQPPLLHCTLPRVPAALVLMVLMPVAMMGTTQMRVALMVVREWSISPTLKSAPRLARGRRSPLRPRPLAAAPLCNGHDTAARVVKVEVAM